MATSRAVLTDLELLRRMVGGDSGALREIHRRYHPIALATASRALRDPLLSQDAVQEAFLDLWRGGATFDPAQAKLSTWIAVLAHRRAVDIARREARRQTDTYEERFAPADTYTTEELVVLREERRSVRAALDSLPPRERTVLELAYYGGLTQAQIAARLGIPLGTAKSRIFHALSRMNALLNAHRNTQPAPV